MLNEWRTSNGRLPVPVDGKPDLTVNELGLAYLRHCVSYYRKPDGSPTTETGNVKYALRYLLDLYGHSLASDFGLAGFKTMRQRMIEAGHCRKRINRDCARIKRMFRWAAGEEMIPIAVVQQLDLVDWLKADRSGAKESKPVRPVPEAVVHETVPLLLPAVRAMVELHLLTGMRPGEVCAMRGIDIDLTDMVWLYRPQSHKTEHHGHQRVVALGPQAQGVLRPWLRLNVEEYLFQPFEAVARKRAEMRKVRKTSVQPSQQNRAKKNPKRQPGDRYHRSAYAYSIRRAIDRENGRRRAAGLAELPRWHPHQLRHAAKLRIKREAGLEAARAQLGHRSAATTEHYGDLDIQKAAETMLKIG